MKIGIIGSGVVGQVLGSAFLLEGYEVMLGTRDTAKPAVAKWKEENAGAQTGTFEETAKFGELLVLCTAGEVAEHAMKMAGTENLRSKIVIDTTNPIAAAAPVNGVLQFFTDHNESLLERLQKLAPEAKMVKAFSCVGNGLMYKPNLVGGPPTMFICGADAKAKKEVTEILTSFGWETEDMGAPEAARAIEPLCILWCIPGFTRNQWGHAFKMLK